MIEAGSSSQCLITSPKLLVEPQQPAELGWTRGPLTPTFACIWRTWNQRTSQKVSWDERMQRRVNRQARLHPWLNIKEHKTHIILRYAFILRRLLHICSAEGEQPGPPLRQPAPQTLAGTLGLSPWRRHRGHMPTRCLPRVHSAHWKLSLLYQQRELSVQASLSEAPRARSRIRNLS